MPSSTFKIELDKAKDRFLTGEGRITHLELLAEYAHIAFDTHKGRTKYLKGYTTDEIRRYAGVFPDLQAYVNRYGPHEGYWRWSRSLPRKVNRLLYQHLVVFLVTILEAFIEDVLLLVLHEQPKCLSSREKDISWEKVIELGDYASVVDYFASQTVATVLSGDWYKIVEKFNKLFNIDLSSEIDGKSIAEIFEIRHAVVHNVGLADQRFINKVQPSEWGIRYSLNKEIILDQQRVERMVSYVEYVVESIYDSILSKFRTN